MWAYTNGMPGFLMTGFLMTGFLTVVPVTSARFGVLPDLCVRIRPIHGSDDSLRPMMLMAAATSAVHALGPAWLNPQTLITDLGTAAFWVVAAIIFAECGLLIGFFLPGDSLLFVTGLFIAASPPSFHIGINIGLACVILAIAALVGNVTGYWIGHKAGPALFRRPDSKVFKQEYVDQTHHFFERYGPRAIVMARFVPIVRTFITAVAGIGRMDFGRYFFFSAIGAVLWAAGVTLAGYFLGNVAFIANHVELILILVVVISVIPMIVEYRRHKAARS